jgi:hypothetical protein
MSEIASVLICERHEVQCQLYNHFSKILNFTVRYKWPQSIRMETHVMTVIFTILFSSFKSNLGYTNGLQKYHSFTIVPLA